MGIESIREIPDDFELSEIQRRAATCVQTGEPWFSPELRQVLGGLIYPLYFADFETVNPAIPRFAGMRPYDQLPFQWSVHVLREPGTELEHFEFLAMDTNDPRHEFITSLCCALGDVGASSCIAPSSRRGSRKSLHGCRNLRGGSRTFKVGSGTCYPSCGNTCTIRRSAGRSR